MKTIAILANLKPLNPNQMIEIINGLGEILEDRTTQVFTLSYSGIWIF